MEDSLKGILIALTLFSLFTTSILSFIVIFPQEQGVSFSDLNSNQTYLAIKNTSLNTLDNLNNIKNKTESGFDGWDITQGFMGSNALKQNSLAGTGDYNTNVWATLTSVANKLFTANSPIMYAILIISTLSGGVLIYYVIKFIRQGQ